MSLGDLVGKLQSVVSSFGTEETKKTEKKEEVSESSSLFESSVKESNEQSDIAGLELGYSEAADDVFEQIFAKKEINRNYQDAKEFQERVNDSLETADIPASVKDKLAPLYNELCSCDNDDKRNQITAQIKKVCAEAEKEGVDESYLKTLDLDIQLDTLHSSNSNKMVALYEKLAEATDDKEREKIHAEIEKENAIYQAESSKTFNQLYIRQHDLSEEQVGGLSTLYSALADATNTDEREMIQSQIKKFCAEENIDYNGELIQELNYNAVQIPQNQKIAELYDKLSETSSEKDRDMIIREINLQTTQSYIEQGEIEQKMIVAEMGLDEKSRDKVFTLLDELSNSKDKFSSEQINDEIAKTLVSAGIDLNGHDYSLLQLTSTNLQKDKELLPLYEQIMTAKSPKKLDEIWQEIEKIETGYEDKFDYLHEKFSNSQKAELKDELSNMYVQLSETTNQDERNRIVSEIIDTEGYMANLDGHLVVNDVAKTLENLGVPNDVINQVTLFASELFADVDNTDTDKILSNIGNIMTQVKQHVEDPAIIDDLNLDIQSAFTEVLRSSELEDLYAQYSNAVSDDDKSMINSKIKQVELKFNNVLNYLESKKLMVDVKSDNVNRLDSLIENINLPEAAKDKFIEKYMELIETNDIPNRDKVLAELQQTVLELNQEFNFDPYGQVMRSINLNEFETRQNIELTDLYGQLSETTDPESRHKLNQKIKALTLEYEKVIKDESYNAWMVDAQQEVVDFINDSLSKSNLPNSVKDELTSLVDDLVTTFDGDERQFQIAKLEQKLIETASEFGFDAKAIRKEILEKEVNMNKEFELAQLQEALLNATSQKEKDVIESKIKQVINNYTKELDSLNKKFK